ncbi:MAG: formylglycine-generating enzyme family protein, partial [Blastocatellia bacterium]
KQYDEPEFWNDTRFNNPAQPVVGVTWFEARAYCQWLSANMRATEPGRDIIYRLPTEAEFEAAARGPKGRKFPYGKDFDAQRGNTFESHIRRTTPVGIFDNATPEGAYDLSGNAWTWTLSVYDQKKYPYPYDANDGREDVSLTGVNRALRGGSWYYNGAHCRAVYRYDYAPGARNTYDGFRVVVRARTL